MLRFAVVASLMALSAAETFTYPQGANMNERQSIGGQASIGLGEFGNFNAGGNLAVPSTNGNFLQTAVYALGAVVLLNILVTVAVPFVQNFLAKPAAPAEGEKKDPKKTDARSFAENVELGQQILGFVQDFAEKYA